MSALSSFEDYVKERRMVKELSLVHLLFFPSCKDYVKCENELKDQWSLYVPPGLTHINSTFCPHSVFMCFVWISEQTAIISLYSINWLVCITETECVYCAVRTGSFYIYIYKSGQRSITLPVRSPCNRCANQTVSKPEKRKMRVILVP